MSAGARSHPIDKAAPETSSGHHDSVARAVGAVGLFGIALIHFIDVFDKFKETPYLGGLYVALIAGCLVAARRLILMGDSTAWLLAGGLAALTFLAYTASRSIGLPASTDDIGNWTEPLGLASVFVEGAISFSASRCTSR